MLLSGRVGIHAVSVAALLSILIGWTPMASGEESRRVRVGESFEVELPFRFGTGTSWRILPLPRSVILISDERKRLFTAPGGRGVHLFVLKATEAGEFQLDWQLTGGSSQIYEVFRVRILASKL